MGFYLNSGKPASLYENETRKPYFVDKTTILEDLFPLVESGTQYICITRPRRFGKTITANMIGAFFGKNSKGSLFDSLQIASCKGYSRHRNQHNVIYMTLNEMPREKSFSAYLHRIEQKLFHDLTKAYPKSTITENDTLWDALNIIHEDYEAAKFIFVLDEWDFIFHRDFVTSKDKLTYITFLSNLLKDQPYVELAYITGILPIAKYSSGSEMNMFREYTMSSQHRFGTYFGFTDAEVDMLYQRYLSKVSVPNVTREGLREWYDGYKTLVKQDSPSTAGSKTQRLYNPRSVVFALENDQLADYWTSSGPYDEIFYYAKNNVAGVRDDIAKMIAGEEVPAQVTEYSATSTKIRTRDEILSAMVVYGFLTASNGKVSIPNRELMDKFVDMVRKENALGYVYRLAKESDRMLAATRAGDTETMAAILQQAHDTETGMTGYNDEAELSAIVRLVYLSARDAYDMEREDKSGVGYVDYIFYPKRDKTDDCIIVELKVNHTAEEAIRQIKSRNYAQRFLGKLGEACEYKGRILAVGIAYSQNDPSKRHECKVEVLREKI